MTIPDAVMAATDVDPDTVSPFDTVALPATEASDWAVNAPAIVIPPFAVINPDAVIAAVVVAPETVSPF